MASRLRLSVVTVLYALSIVSAVPAPAGLEPTFEAPHDPPTPTPSPIYIGANVNPNGRAAAPAAVVAAAAVNNYVYNGCYTDKENARTFPASIVLTNTNSPEACTRECRKYGYEVAGVQYSSECFCGDHDDIKKSGVSKVAESQCNMACSGNPNEKCGGDWRLNVYSWIGSPRITKFATASGAAAGEYKFLIGSPIVPLHVTLGINGKVTFLEKSRETTTIKNSTGAYELDLSRISNWNEAWREMSMKTDVFCSAGIVLPDKAGRQLTVGGWSDVAARGVRTYYPDGKPGTRGKNDWDENANQVSLLVNRWYGTAMMMVNGSVLVVGGQVGAGGAPSPTLELLPRTGKNGHLVYLDFLARTNPDNLYPFLTQLPSGKIFIGYYNEARVLDENTFAVTKTLPNMPGLIDRIGGRVYPYSGAFTIMPIRYPYTDPMTVMICGGSTPRDQIGIDNCISIQPEASNPQWTIERTPSRRVMPLLVALPDGTYLILGGAKRGVGGFATSSDPNNRAELYDPRKPVGQRFTRMASTPVARLYHSEAILLQDGRVMVSGSDPEDPRYPQEFRIEVFRPPYLTQNKPRPTFTITDKDWALSEKVKVTVKVSSASAKVEASLVAAEVSTHNYNMGQRIVFPKITCTGSGTTKDCTIEAPFRRRIAFGWFQLFILENSIPSNSVWVRIGKDPGNIGAWPPFSTFKKPGAG